jgi:hypothetical protein
MMDKVEIVGVDTSDSTQYQIYAWSWNEHFIQKGTQDYSGNKQLLITKFSVDPTSRARKILNVFVANPELPIEQQLKENGFPASIIDEYFTNQSENVERIRIQALTKKATDKYSLFKEHIYTPDTTLIVDSLPIVDSLTQ